MAWYFLRYSSYNKKPPLDASLFGDIRKFLGQELTAEMNHRIHEFPQNKADQSEDRNHNDKDEPSTGTDENKWG